MLGNGSRSLLPRRLLPSIITSRIMIAARSFTITISKVTNDEATAVREGQGLVTRCYPYAIYIWSRSSLPRVTTSQTTAVT
jgi:hypothetical protein